MEGKFFGSKFSLDLNKAKFQQTMFTEKPEVGQNSDQTSPNKKQAPNFADHVLCDYLQISLSF